MQCIKKKIYISNTELIKEWDYSKNIGLDPTLLTHGSHKKVWWKCKNNHEYQSVICDVFIRNSSCPYCINNPLAVTHPHVAKEWDYSKNILTPNDVVAGSGKKYWFVCHKKHSWTSSLCDRVRRNGGCPYCSNKKVCKDNCLTVTHPNISKEWDYVKNKLTPNDVVAGSDKKYWWICNNGHSWEAILNNRTSGGCNCPYCSNKKLCNDNSLSIKFPNISKEWDYSKNKLLPIDVNAKSVKKYWFKCIKNHSWIASLRKRTVHNTGCPHCNESRGEKKIVEVLDKLDFNYERQFKFKNCKNKTSLPFDFKVNLNDKYFMIEYHGIQHYKLVTFGVKDFNKAKINFQEQKDRDKIKYNYCKDNNINILYIKYTDFNNIESIIKKFIYNMTYKDIYSYKLS